MDRRDDQQPPGTDSRSERAALVPVLRRGRHDPRVDRRPDGGLVYEIYVASGHADRVCRFPLAPRHLPVLRDDAERYFLLYAALHRPYQLAETELDDAERERWFDLVLHAPQADVEAFLTAQDHGPAHGAVSNLLRLITGADHATLRRGRWFGVGVDTPPSRSHG